MHSETYYSFIYRLCSCDIKKENNWKLSNESTPHFYIGPADMMLHDFKKVLSEYNTTTCGPIFFGEPPEPDLTIITTSYADSFKDPATIAKLNDPKHLFICHNDAPHLEGDNASSVFWLTPHHSRYVVPSYFPPTMVQRSRLHHPNNGQPIFLIIGNFNDVRKRNVNSLKTALEVHRNKNFAVQFLDGGIKPFIKSNFEGVSAINFPRRLFKDCWFSEEDGVISASCGHLQHPGK